MWKPLFALSALILPDSVITYRETTVLFLLRYIHGDQCGHCFEGKHWSPNIRQQILTLSKQTSCVQLKCLKLNKLLCPMREKCRIMSFLYVQFIISEWNFCEDHIMIKRGIGLSFWNWNSPCFSFLSSVWVSSPSTIKCSHTMPVLQLKNTSHGSSIFHMSSPQTCSSSEPDNTSRPPGLTAASNSSPANTSPPQQNCTILSVWFLIGIQTPFLCVCLQISQPCSMQQTKTAWHFAAWIPCFYAVHVWFTFSCLWKLYAAWMATEYKRTFRILIWVHNPPPICLIL